MKILACLSCLAYAIAVCAQNDEIRITNYGFEDGLSHRNVYKVQQDKNGFLWIATAKGLNRFDGHKFLPWATDQKNDKLPADLIQDILIDDNNRIWLANGTGITVFKPDENILDSVGSKGRKFKPGHLCLDGLGHLWTTAYFPQDTSLWLQKSDDDLQLTNVVKLPGLYQGRPIVRQAGLIYVGAYENELWVFDLDGRQVKQYEFPILGNEKQRSRVIMLQTAKDGTIWAMLESGQLYYLPLKGAAFQRHPVSDLSPPNLRPTAFCVAENGDIWLGGIVAYYSTAEDEPCSSTQPGPFLLHYNATSGQAKDLSYFLKQALPFGEPPRHIYRDLTGVIWISTEFGLVHLVENNLFASYMSDGNDCCQDGVCSMRGITEDEDGNIYFSYYSSMHVLNPKTGSLVPLFPEQIGIPYDIRYAYGALWTGDGLRIDLGTLRIDTLLPEMQGAEGVLMEDADGMIWFGSKDQLKTLDPATGQASDFPLPFPTGPITYLHPGKTSDYFWVGTRENGFIKVSVNGETTRQYHTGNRPELTHDRILALLELNNKLWLATASGLGVMNLADESLTVYSDADGLPNNFINGLLPEGDSAIWASTDNGLSRFDLRTKTFSNYFTSDGLSKNEFNRISFHLAKDGRMYFGGLNGINAFYPNAHFGNRQDKQNSKLMLTEFNKFDGEIDHHQNWGLARKEPVKLSYKDQIFTFHFSLADFSDPDIHLYSYMLEGYDKEWSEKSPINFARYFNIPPGKYHFRVRASRGGGDWVKNELGIPVVINQAFYKTRLFQMLALGLLTVLIFVIMRYRLYLATKHEQELESLVKERTQELETEKRKSDDLLLNILPAETAEELKQNGTAKARRFDNVTVLFSDFKRFSIIAKGMEPEALVAEIDYCFRAFDRIIDEFGLEKIKTVGDAYLCGGGFGNDNDAEEAARVIKAAMKIQAFLNKTAEDRKVSGQACFQARMGIHTGPVVGGIVGIKKFAYDIWGDTVNISERLQANGEVDKVNISKSTYELIKDQFQCTYRGKIAAKHQGEVDMYFVEKILSD